MGKVLQLEVKQGRLRCGMTCVLKFKDGEDAAGSFL